MAIASPVAGAYVGTFNRGNAGFLPLNYTRQGYTLNFSQKGERVEETDLYALCFIELVGRGCQLTIETICKVYSEAVVGAFWPWAAPFGRVYDLTTPLATLANLIPDILLLTAVAGTPAAASPATLTASVVLSPDANLQINFNSTLREVPLRFDCLLQDAGVTPAGTGTLFTTT